MDRLTEMFRLESDGLTFLLRMLTSSALGLDEVSPGDIYLSRAGTRIDHRDPALRSIQGWGILEGARDWLDTTDAASLFVTGFRFQDDDQESLDWYPQGLTGTGDAHDSGRVDGEKFLVVAWYNKANQDHYDEPMSRISLVNVSDMDDVRYRHLLLIEPIWLDGVQSFQAVETHCGGVVWFGRWLYVASSDRLRVFDMEGILDLKAQNPDYLDSQLIGYYDGKYHGAGYRYIVPQVAVYTIDGGDRGNYFDTLGLDRSTDPPRLVAAAYVGTSSRFDQDVTHEVVVFFELNTSTGLLANTGGHVEASDAAYTDELYVQGVHACGDRVWLCQSSDVNRLLRREVGGTGGDQHEWALGGEGLTYAPTTDHLWNVTEVDGRRICFCVNRADVW